MMRKKLSRERRYADLELVDEEYRVFLKSLTRNRGEVQ